MLFFFVKHLYYLHITYFIFIPTCNQLKLRHYLFIYVATYTQRLFELYSSEWIHKGCTLNNNDLTSSFINYENVNEQNFQRYFWI